MMDRQGKVTVIFPDGVSEERLARRLEAVAALFMDAEDKGLKEGHGGQGSMKCPLCPGVIKYSVAASNGHMWATCGTFGCVRFFQ